MVVGQGIAGQSVNNRFYLICALLRGTRRLSYPRFAATWCPVARAALIHGGMGCPGQECRNLGRM